MVADQKKRITLQNFNMLIKKGLVPDYLADQMALYNFTRYIRKSKRDGTHYLLDEFALDYYFEGNYDLEIIDYDLVNGENVGVIPMSYWDNIYENEMNKVRAWMERRWQQIFKEN